MAKGSGFGKKELETPDPRGGGSGGVKEVPRNFFWRKAPKSFAE